jgi:hypothetical protein
MKDENSELDPDRCRRRLGGNSLKPLHKEDLKESFPSSIECWACEEASKEGLSSK